MLRMIMRKLNQNPSCPNSQFIGCIWVWTLLFKLVLELEIQAHLMVLRHDIFTI